MRLTTQNNYNEEFVERILIMLIDCILVENAQQLEKVIVVYCEWLSNSKIEAQISSSVIQERNII